MNPAVSVVMPVRNPHAEQFPHAVRSLLAQTLEDFEVLVVEDAGPRPGEPEPRSVTEALASIADPRVQHLRSENAGIAAARNLGVQHASAPLIAMLDADDEALPERLERQAQRMAAEPELAALGTQLQLMNEGGDTVGLRRYPTDHAAILAAMPILNPIGQPSVMLRKAAVDAIGGYRDRTCEDYDLWSRMALAGHRFANLDTALVRYRLHTGAMKSRKLRASLRDTIDIKREHWRGKQSLRGRLRLLGEHALLLLPPALVMAMFQRLHTRQA